MRRMHTINLENNKEKQEKKFTCDKCNKNFNTLQNITDHVKNDCRPSIKSNNIYRFKTITLGKNKYKGNNGGDIYIIQTEFNLKGFYKIGISTNLYKRLGQYRCGSVLEPKLHYYYPCKNIKEADKQLKKKLKNFNIKREIYKSDNIDDFRNIIKQIQKENNSLELEIIPENKECEIKACTECNLYFTNQQDLEIHFKNIHNKILDESNKEKCKFCKKILANRHSRWRHEKNCKEIEKSEIEEIKKENLQIREQLIKLEKIIKNFNTKTSISV